MSMLMKSFLKDILGFIYYNFYYRFTKKTGNRVLIYHAFGTELSHDTYGISIAIKDFDKHLKYLKLNEKVVAISDVYDKKSYSNENTISITMDDGYKDNLLAIKLLEEYRLPYTIYIATGFIGKDGYLSEDDIRGIACSTLCTIGSHTVTHTPLSKLTEEQQNTEIVASKLRLEGIIGKDISHFSFPHGDYDKTSKDLVDDTYDFVSTSHYGVNSRLDKKRIKRIEIVSSDTTKKLKRKVYGFYDFLELKR